MPDQAEPGGDLAERIVAAFEVDFTDRRGLRQEWEQIDEDTLVEIRQTWTRIVRDELNTRPDQSLQHSDRSARPLEVIRTFMKPDGTLNLDRAATQAVWDECQRVEDVYYERDEARATIVTMQKQQCADCVTIGKLHKIVEALRLIAASWCARVESPEGRPAQDPDAVLGFVIEIAEQAIADFDSPHDNPQSEPESETK